MSTPCLHWHLGRNCAMRPRTFGLHLLALSLLCCLTGAAFWAAGYPVVMGFCVLQVALLFGSGLYFAIHAADGEHVELAEGALQVHVADGFKAQVYRFNPAWTRLEPNRCDGDCFWLCSGRERVPLGRHLTADRRRQAAREIAQALQREREGGERRGASPT